MPDKFNYAESWSPRLLQIIMDGTLTSPFITTNVQWLGAKSFHFTQKSVSGFKNHKREGGWNRGTITDADKVFTVAHDRDVEFLIDKINVDETNQTASIQNTAAVFTQTQQAPETDAYFYERVAAAAVENNLFSETALSAWTKSTVLEKLKACIKPCKRYKSQMGGLIGYLRTEIMDALSLCPEFTRKIDVTTVGESGASIQTRITSLDGVTFIEVLDDERFYTAFDYEESFKVKSDSQALNVVIASPLTIKTVPKISSIYYFAPGQHTMGDGYLYQHRALWDTFVFPNGRDGKVDSVFIDRQPASASPANNTPNSEEK